MHPDQAREWIEALQNLDANQWLDGLLVRQGPLPPALLPVLGYVPRLAPLPAAVLGQMDALRHLPYQFDHRGQPLSWAEPPWLQVQRAAVAVLAGQGVAAQPPHRGPAPGFPPRVVNHMARSAEVSASWLQQASAWGPDALPPFGNWQPSGVVATVQLPLALVDAASQGRSATLTLHRVTHEGGGLCLAPAPASALLLRTGPEWDTALADVRIQVADLLKAERVAELRNTAIAWDLALTGTDRLASVSGPSASASLALGMLWLLRAWAPGVWRQSLDRITAEHLAIAALSAALDRHFRLLPVGSTLPKAESLQAMQRALARHPRAPQLVLHVSNDQDLPSAPVPGQVPHLPHATLLTLLNHLADQADPLSDDQARLLQALLQPGDAPPRFDDDPKLLQRVYDAPVESLRQYLLHCWAAFGRLLGGQLHHRFVPLSVAPDARGIAHPSLLSGLHGPFHGGLQQVLDKLDGEGIQGYVLRGQPGAGKTTLLRHHLQLMARDTLRELCLPVGDRPSEAARRRGATVTVPEVPVYLSLAGLKPGMTDIAGWVRQQLAKFPEPLTLLLQGGGAWARQGLRARVLLDGLNELPVAHADLRAARAAEVVQAVHHHLATGAGQGAPLPLLLSIREHHALQLGAFVALTVDVLAWSPSQIQAYLALRFPQDGDQGASRLQVLQNVPGALDLCTRPMHLALQCDLMDDGFAAPPSNRAALYAAWLWRALRRALNADGRHPAHDDPTLWQEEPGAGPDAVLLTDADRHAITSGTAWREGRLHRLPLQGQLLRCLMQQAEVQWWAGIEQPGTGAATAGGAQAGADRTAEPVAWAGVAAHLPAGLRQRFGRAAHALGLVTLDEGFATWQFVHPSWGEYLAACRLLDAGPPVSPRLLQRLKAVQPPYGSDEEQLQALAGGGPAWREVPDALWAQLMQDGLQVDLDALANSFHSAECIASTTLEERLTSLRIRALPDYIEREMLDVDVQAGLATADLERWARESGVDDALGLAPGAWRTSAAGWQFLVQQRLFPVFQQAFWAWLARQALAHGLPADLPQRLQQDLARLELPPQPDGAEVLGLALQGLDDAALVTWLQALLADERGTLWPALEPVLPALQARLEPQGAWGEHAPPGTLADQLLPPHPLLQHLRRVLLLSLLDAGAASATGVRTSGMLALLDACNPPGLPAPLSRRWKALRTQAFQGAGQRLAVRLQAGLLLGRLGDTIRYERRARSGAPGDWGLRPRRALWAEVGDLEEASFHAIGSPEGQGLHAGECPPWQVQLSGFEACRLPLTVAEWACFHRSPACQAQPWSTGEAPDFNNPLQPVTGITWLAARDYAEWAQPMYDDWQAADIRAGRQPLRPAMPTELQWEAAACALAPPPTLREQLFELWQRVRGRQALVQPLRLALEGPWQDLAFNHANTRWLRTSPVGCFSRDYTPAGLADVRGNVWEWCSNALSHAQLRRGWRSDADRRLAGELARADTAGTVAVRGCAFNNSTDECRTAHRRLGLPDSEVSDVGVRFVRCWLPHSEL